MAESSQQPPSLYPPIIDDRTVKDSFAEECAGIHVAGPNMHLTFVSYTADHTEDPAPTRRVVALRVVIPIPGAIGLRDLLTHVIDTLTQRGAIVSEPTPPTIITPPAGRPH